MSAHEMSSRWFPRLRRFARGLALVIVAIAAVYGIATVVLGRRYEAELGRIRQRGEPVTMSDLARLAGQPAPDSENAALVYKGVFPKLKEPEMDRLVEALDRVNPRDSTVKTPEVWAAAKSAAKEFDFVVPVAEEAAAMPRCLFHVEWEKGCGATFEHYQGMRNVTRVLADKAVVYAHDGQTGEALHCVELALGLAERVKNDPILIGALVRMALVNFASRASAEMVRQCDISEAQAKRLYDELGAVDLSRQSRVAWMGDRAWGIWAFDSLLRDGWSAWGKLLPKEDVPPRILYGYKPVMYADALIYLSYMTAQAKASNVPFRLIRPDERSDESEMRRLPSYARLTRLLVPCYAAFRRSRDRCMAEINLARAGLALVAYKDRFGAYPEPPDEAVRRLGWSPLPEDPFSGKALVYKPYGKGFVVYSIGPNLKDDGGQARGQDEDEEKAGDIVVSRER